MADARFPFYTQITSVKEESVDLPLVTLPAGTVLFRGLKIPNAGRGEDIRYFYRDFLGDPQPGGKVCLSPIHNVFFYPFPYVAFGAIDVGKTFTMFQMVVLVNPVTVVAATSPSVFVRGTAKRFDGNAPWQRCDKFMKRGVSCSPPTAKELDAASYDNCLNPIYQKNTNVRGWMAIANLDSLNPIKKGQTNPTNPMREFVKRLETLLPGQGSQAVVNTYTDGQGHAGFPEIALYPYKNHKGAENIIRPCANDMAAMRLIEQEAITDNLNYLPLATFTKNGVFDMVNGDYNYQILKPTPNAFSPEGAQVIINQNVFAYMNKLQKEGIDLPFYGKAQLSFDSRTGFFVLNAVVPKTLRIPIPKAVQNAEQVASTTSYTSILMPLVTDNDIRRVNRYSKEFRTFVPQSYMKKFQLDRFTFRNSMVFNRYPHVRNILKEMGLPIPYDYEVKGENYYEYAAVTPPPSDDESPKTPTYRGGRTTRSRRSRGQVLAQKGQVLAQRGQTMKTKSKSQPPVKKYTSLFTRVWKIHGKSKA